MENASKALIMAAGILVFIIVIALGIYLYIAYNNFGKSYDEILDTNEKIKFNTNFIKYEGRKDITPQEIVTVKNFATNYQVKTGIEVKVEAPVDTDNINFIKENPETIYTCEGITYGPDGLVNSISFETP